MTDARGGITLLILLGKWGFYYTGVRSKGMAEEEYTIKMYGPDGYVEFVSYELEEALEIAENLLEASNGHHDVKIEPPLS